MEYNVFQNNRILELAKHNDWAKLYNLLDIFCDDTKNALKIKKEEYLENGKYPIVDQGQSFIAGYTNNDEYLYTDTPSIIFGDHTRVLKYIDFPIFIGADGVKLLKLKINDGNINVKFIYYFLKTVELPSDGYSRHFKYLKQVIVPIPKRIIQDKIVEVLDKAQELINKRKEQIEALDELVKSKFIEMFGDPVSNKKNLSKVKLGDIGDWKAGGTPSRSNNEYYNGTIPWLSSGELNSIYCFDSIEKITEKAIEESSAKIITKGSLLLGMYDTAALKSTINMIECSCNQAIAYSNLNDNIVNTVYVYYCIQIGKEFYKSQQRGVRQKNLNLSMVKNLEILLPNLNLQKQFADFVKEVDNLKLRMEKSLKELEDNFNSLMQRAFKGELFN